MSLDIKIFWVEDDESWLDGAKEVLQDLFLQKWGLNLIVDHYQANTDIDGVINAGFKEYDFAIIDYKIGNPTDTYETGDKIVKKLRDSSIYTEVIFYSVDENGARDSLINSGLALSGIYFVPRSYGAAPQEFVDRCEPIIKAMLHKALDLIRDRGIVVSVTSEIDAKLTQLIQQHPNFPSIIGHNLILDIAKEINVKQGEQYDKTNMRNKSSEHLIADHRVAGWLVKIKIVKRLLQGTDSASTFSRFETCATKVRSYRNKLAHNPNLTYDDNKLKEIRRLISECNKLLDEVFEQVFGESNS